jgi:hypothetical protein
MLAPSGEQLWVLPAAGTPMGIEEALGLAREIERIQEGPTEVVGNGPDGEEDVITWG